MPLGSGMIDVLDREPTTIPHTASFGDALEILFSRKLWGVPVIDDKRDLIGLCTIRSALTCTLPIVPDNMLYSPRRAPADERSLLQARLRGASEVLVTRYLDIDAPVVRESTSLQELILLLARRTPMLAVVADQRRQLVGVASWERTLSALWRHRP